MGIDIYARWKSQSAEEVRAQMAAWFSLNDGKLGYLRESYHGEPYATRFLCREAFWQHRGAQIPAAVLRSRLEETLQIAEANERTQYHSGVQQIDAVKQNYRDFVDLCERKEQENGEPVYIIADR